MKEYGGAGQQGFKPGVGGYSYITNSGTLSNGGTQVDEGGERLRWEFIKRKQESKKTRQQENTLSAKKEIKKERRKERNQVPDQGSDQEKTITVKKNRKKTRSRPRK